MTRAANRLGVGVGAVLIVIGVFVGLVGIASGGGYFALGIGLLAVMWGGIVAAICGSNLRRSRGITRA